MELGFIVSAIRRYWWIVAACVALGALPGFLDFGGLGQYESTGSLLILQPANFGGDPDRYITGQLTVLRSDVTAQRVADEVGDGATAASVSLATTFEHEPRSDIVRVTVDATTPELARDIGNAYMNQYIAELDEAATQALDPFDAEIDRVEGQIGDVDNRIKEVMAPFVEQQTQGDSAFPVAIPGVDQIAPELVSQRDILLNQYEGLLAVRAQILSGSQASGSGRVIQAALLPAAPVPSSSNLTSVVGVVAGGFLGSLIAVLWARLSPRVLNDAHAADILGVPVVGAIPKVKVSRDPRKLFNLPRPLMAFVDTLCVRSEAAAKGSDAVTVVVVASQPRLGTSTLAVAMAKQFCAHGARVLLVDANLRQPRLSVALGLAPGRPGGAEEPARVLEGEPHGPLGNVIDTGVDRLAAATIATRSEGQPMRRQHVADVVNTSAAAADTAVFDGGVFLTSASTVELARMCDAVVLVMSQRQDARELALIAEELRSRSVFPVWAPKGVERRRRRKASSGKPAGQKLPPSNAVQPIEATVTPPPIEVPDVAGEDVVIAPADLAVAAKTADQGRQTAGLAVTSAAIATDASLDRPDISVVIPTHNRSRLLRRLLGQLLSIDDGLRYELIVVDEGSTDDTSAVLERMATPQLRVVRNDDPRGPAAARNIGLRLASAEYVAWIDDDDLTAPDRLRRQRQALVELGMEWSCAARANIDDSLNVIGHASCPPAEGIVGALLRSNVIPAAGQGLLVRRDLADAVGGFDESIRVAEDWEFCIRLVLRAPPHFLDEPLVGYRVVEPSLSTNTAVMELSIRQVIAKHADAYRQYGVEPDWLAIDESLLDADLGTSRRRACARAARILRRAPSGRPALRLAAVTIAPQWARRRSAAKMSAKVPANWREMADSWLSNVPVI